MRVAVSCDGSRVVTIGVDRKPTIVCDIAEGDAEARFGPPIAYGRSWTLSPDGSVLAEPKADGSVLLWDESSD
jgi:hypothetical protein